MRFEYTFECPEPEGVRKRHVRPLELQDMPRVYQEMLAHHVSKGANLSPETAWEEFHRLDKLYWIVDDVGLLFITMGGDSHVFFWDRRLRGREGLVKTMLRVSMEIFDLEEAWTTIPRTGRIILAFAKRLGFVEQEERDGLIKLTFARGQ